MRFTAAAIALCAVMLLLVPSARAVSEGSDSPESAAQAGSPGAPPATGVSLAEAPSGSAPADTSAARAGRRVFIGQSCSLCHTAYALGVGEAPEGWKPEPAPDLDEPAPGPPDLSVLPAMWTAALLREYLVDRVEIDGEKHVTSFKGSDEDWAALVEWLLSTRADSSTVVPQDDPQSTDAPVEGEGDR